MYPEDSAAINHDALAKQRAYYEASQLQGLAQGSASNYGADVRPTSGLLEAAAQKLQTLAMILDDTLGDLGAVNMRLFGPRPPSATTANGARGVSISGNAGELLQALDLLCEKASASREEARGLNARL